MMAATMMSGQPVPVPNTPATAAMTARFPIASLREQIQTDRILESPVVDTKIASLKTLRRELNDIIRQCHSGTIEECRIIDALGFHAATHLPSV